MVRHAEATPGRPILAGRGRDGVGLIPLGCAPM